MYHEKLDSKWWSLHLKKARGETLNPEDLGYYESALRQLHESEEFPGQLAALRQLRQDLAVLESENSTLQVQRQALDKEIANLEALLLGRAG